MAQQAAHVTEYRQWRFALPPGGSDLLLIRHGESMPAREDEPPAMIGGQSDPGLAPEGREQAERIADRLARERVDAIYVTSLRRTAETAAPLAARLAIRPQVEADLREVMLGEWEGAAFRRYTAQGHPLAVRMFTEQRWDVIPGAEPSEQFAARVRRGIERIAAAHPDQRVAVVVHGGVVGMVLSLATGAGPFQFATADNGSISEIVVTPGHWLVRRFNDVAHLERPDA